LTADAGAESELLLTDALLVPHPPERIPNVSNAHPPGSCLEPLTNVKRN
jgi:hypothetical protein